LQENKSHWDFHYLSKRTIVLIKIIERVARDIQNEFPGIKGFSKTNIGRMKAFYQAYSISPQAVGKIEDLPVFNIPWGHNIVLFESVKDVKERLWYASMVIAEEWSRNALMDAIKIKTYKRYGKAITNFHERLPPPQSQLAHDTLKDPYNNEASHILQCHRSSRLIMKLSTYLQS
jgi:predicted nuclease of restriction endonuclease-like (RecB) superfamily